MHLPDISTSVIFWASIATMWSAAGAWFTFLASAHNSRRDTYTGIQSLLIGLNAELDFVKSWASGEEGDVGYVLPENVETLTREHPDWFNPSRFIFAVETPILQRFTASPYLYRLGPVVGPLVKLNYSLRRLFDLHADYRAFINGNPSLCASVFRKLKQPAGGYTLDEQNYMNVVFEMNVRMHHALIGGENSSDDLCLYKAYRSARAALNQFANDLRPEPLPRWFWVLHAFAGSLAVGGALEIFRWFSIV